MTADVDEEPEPLGRPFWSAFGAMSAANLADGISLTGIPLLAVSLTDDPLLVALVGTARFVPVPLLALPVGTLVDRVDRRRLLVLTQVIRAVTMIALTIITVSSAASIWWLIIGAFVVGAGEIVTDSGVPALVRSMLNDDQFEVANSRLSLSETVANMFIGPLAGATLFIVDPALPLLADAASFAVAAVLLATMPGSYRPSAERRADADGADGDSGPDGGEDSETAWGRLTFGLRYVWGNLTLRLLALAVGMFSFLGAGVNAVAVILFTDPDHYGFGEVGFAAVQMVAAAASIGGALVVVRVARTAGRSASMRFAAVAFGIGWSVLGLASHQPVAFVSMALVGVTSPLWNVVSSSLRQRIVPDALFGRMMSAYLFVAWGLQPVGSALAGIVAREIGVEWVFIPIAPIMVVGVVVARPLWRRVDAVFEESRGTTGT